MQLSHPETVFFHSYCCDFVFGPFLGTRSSCCEKSWLGRTTKAFRLHKRLNTRPKILHRVLTKSADQDWIVTLEVKAVERLAQLIT